jgi:hypothetical protein
LAGSSGIARALLLTGAALSCGGLLARVVSVADKRLDLRSPILHSSKHLLIVLVVVKTKSKSDYSPILRSGVYLANQNGCAIAPMLVLLKNLTATKLFETSNYSWLQHALEQGWTSDFDSNFDERGRAGCTTN